MQTSLPSLLLLTAAAAIGVSRAGQAPPPATQPADSPARHWSEAARRVVLDNGLTVLLLQRGELPLVSLQALYKVGSRNEHPGITGGAHYVEHMAFRSTEGIAPADLTNQILRWGGRWNGYTSYDQTVYGSHTASQYLEWLVFLERERLDRVIFDADEVERERTSVIAELRQYENSPAYTLSAHRLRRTALVAHPYGSPIMGWISDLEGVTAADLERFYRDYYAPDNLVLAFVGRFDEQEALALVRKHFGGLPRGGRSTAVRTVEPEQTGTRRVTLKGPGSSSHLEMVVHAPAAGDEEFAALLVLDGVLAGGRSPGRGSAAAGSRLHRALIEPGLTALVGTRTELSEYPGLYGISLTMGAGADVGAVEQRLGEALDEVAAAVSDEEVRRAAGQIRAALVFAADSNRAVANLLSVSEGIGARPLLAALPGQVARVTAEDVRRLAAERLRPDRRTIGRFVPEQPQDAVPQTSSPAPAPATASAAPARATRGDRRVPPPPDLRVPSLPAPAVRTLRNGLVVSALTMPGEAAHVRIRIAAGALHDPDGREGLALLTARLLDEGSRGREGARIGSLLADRHVRLEQSAYDADDPAANRHHVEIAAALLNADLGEALELLAGLLRDPLFPDEAVERGRHALAAELDARQDDTDWRAREALFARLFPGNHPFGRPIGGRPESLDGITRADVAGFHRRYFRPNRTVVSIAGGVPGEQALAAAAAAFGGWRAPDGPDEPPMKALPPPREGGRLHVSLPHKAQASIAVGLPGVRRSDPDYAALAALNYLLGETGYAGRLGDTLVTSGLAYAVYASVVADRTPGPILITTNAVRAEETVDRIVEVLQGFTERGVTQAELREAQGFLLGRLLFRFESAAEAARTLADLAWFGAPADLRRFAREVRALTVQDLNRVAARYYDPSRAAFVTAGRR